MMISAITPEPPVSGTNSFSDYRYRPTMGERTVLPDSAPATPKNSTASNNEQFSQSERQARPQPDLPRPDASSMFAAAVIAGTLSPTPKTMEEVILRIGTSTIPAESEARLKDLMV